MHNKYSDISYDYNTLCRKNKKKKYKNKKTKQATAESFGGLFYEICKILLL